MKWLKAVNNELKKKKKKKKKKKEENMRNFKNNTRNS